MIRRLRLSQLALTQIIGLSLRHAVAASTATIYCRFTKTINRNGLNTKVAELRRHDPIQGVQRNVETVYANKLVIWKSEMKEEKLTNDHT
jgi:hypothetical protein